MLSQQEISDRFEIQDLVHQYSHIIDQRDFDLLRSDIFTEDAFIDYTAMGGAAGDVDSTIIFLKSALTESLFPKYQHLNANIQISITGDTAGGRIMCFNPMEASTAESESRIFFLGLWYLDKYVRTRSGWRISKRVEESSWAFNLPDFISLGAS